MHSIVEHDFSSFFLWRGFAAISMVTICVTSSALGLESKFFGGGGGAGGQKQCLLGIFQIKKKLMRRHDALIIRTPQPLGRKL
jgi:hypothetical protein